MTPRLIKYSGHIIDLGRGSSAAPVRLNNVFAVAGDGEALVYWNDTSTPSAPATVTASTGQTVIGTTPVHVTGLANGTVVTFTVRQGTGPVSWASDPITPTSGDAGVIYYVDSVAGSNSNAGTNPSAPLRTASAAAALPLGPGDAVLFKRGSTWANDSLGQINPILSGSANRPVTIAAYGRGAAPQFEGGQAVAGWSAYTTQPTNSQLLTNNTIETFSAFSASVVATGWHSFIGSGGGTQSKETTIVDSGSTGAQKMTYGSGNNIFDQGTGIPLTAGIQYTWTTRLATDAAGAAAGIGVWLQVYVINPSTGGYLYLRTDGTWSSTQAYCLTATPITSYSTFTVVFTPPVSGGVNVMHHSIPGMYAGKSIYIDNNSLNASAPAPTSPNTYRVAVPRATGNVVSMLWVNGNYRTPGTDPDRLPNLGWYATTSYLYYRDDSSNPATDGRTYEVPNTNTFAYLRGPTDWTIRDLSFRLYDACVASAQAGGSHVARIVFAENNASMVGNQVNIPGVGNNNGVFNLTVCDVSSAIRGNVITKANTDAIYCLAAANLAVTDNVVTLVIGDSADCCQIGDATGTSQGNFTIARNVFDNRGTPSPKGCILVNGSAITAGLVTQNTLYGGHFGFAYQSSGIEVSYNVIAYVGTDANNPATWAAGIYSDYSGNNIGATNIHHNLIHDCYNGFNLTSGTRSGHAISKNTITACTAKGFSTGVSWSGSTMSNNIFYNPSASGGEGAPLVAPGLTETGDLAGSDPKFSDLVNYAPSLAAAAGKGWTAP